jgi:hypothetical protein
MLAKQRFKGSTGRCGLSALSRPGLNPVAVIVVVLVLVLVLVVGRALLMSVSDGLAVQHSVNQAQRLPEQQAQGQHGDPSPGQSCCQRAGPQLGRDPASRPARQKRAQRTT